MEQILNYGDYFVMIVLGLMSIWGVKIGVERVGTLRRLGVESSDLDSEMMRQIYEKYDEFVADTDTFDQDLVIAMQPWDTELRRGLPVLGTMGNSAPFIGLFGTVLGIIKAFQDLATAQQAGPQVVMAGISAALIATAMGLIVAIPSVIAYNYFSLRSAAVRSQIRAHVWRRLRSS